MGIGFLYRSLEKGNGFNNFEGFFFFLKEQSQRKKQGDDGDDDDGEEEGGVDGPTMHLWWS